MNDSEQAPAGTSTNKTLPTVAIIGLLAGLGVGLLALAGPLAVWLGLGDFRLGFKLLQMANSWAGWVAAICLVLAIVVFVVGRNRAAGGRPGVMLLLGAISAALAWYVPQTFRPAEAVPVIHDIATDPYDPVEFVAIVPLRTDAPNNLDYGVMPGIESVQEHIDMQRAAYPDIEPQVFAASADKIFDQALVAVDAMGWELVASEPQSGRIEATDTTFWFRFKDDVAIEISENPDGDTVLQARSVSRVGRGDVGKNAERLREFFALMKGA